MSDYTAHLNYLKGLDDLNNKYEKLTNVSIVVYIGLLAILFVLHGFCSFNTSAEGSYIWCRKNKQVETVSSTAVMRALEDKNINVTIDGAVVTSVDEVADLYYNADIDTSSRHNNITLNLTTMPVDDQVAMELSQLKAHTNQQ